MNTLAFDSSGNTSSITGMGYLSRLSNLLSSFGSIQILRSPDGFVAVTTLLTQSVSASIGAIMLNFVSFSSSFLSLSFSAKGTLFLIAQLLGGFPGLLQRRLETP